MGYPTEYKYTKEHEWLKIEGNTAVIGITAHAQEQLGDIVYVEFPEVGDEFAAGDEFGSVESVKAVAEVFMPVSGSITAVNEALEEQPELVNQSPHEDGWLVKVTLSDLDQLSGLMDAAAYEAFAAEES